MEKNHRSESFILQEAETIVEKYIKQRQEKEFLKLEEKYERLKITSIVMGIVSSIGILLAIILK